jgi:ABC-type uncharacterized transport system auxiliary subunit
MPRNDYLRARIAYFVVVILALAGMLLACGPQRRPEGTFPKPVSAAEYNRKHRQRLRTLELNQLRCMGGGLGGCPGFLLQR